MKIVAAEPMQGEPVQGLRSLDDGFIPPIIDLSLLDRKIFVTNHDAIVWTRRLLDEEGIFAGVSTRRDRLDRRADRRRARRGQRRLHRLRRRLEVPLLGPLHARRSRSSRTSTPPSGGRTARRALLAAAPRSVAAAGCGAPAVTRREPPPGARRRRRPAGSDLENAWPGPRLPTGLGGARWGRPGGRGARRRRGRLRAAGTRTGARAPGPASPAVERAALAEPRSAALAAHLSAISGSARRTCGTARGDLVVEAERAAVRRSCSRARLVAGAGRAAGGAATRRRGSAGGARRARRRPRAGRRGGDPESRRHRSGLRRASCAGGGARRRRVRRRRRTAPATSRPGGRARATALATASGLRGAAGAARTTPPLDPRRPRRGRAHARRCAMLRLHLRRDRIYAPPRMHSTLLAELPAPP